MGSKHRPRDIEMLMRFLERAEDAWLAAASPTGLQCSMLLEMIADFQRELAGLDLSELERRAANARLNQLIAIDHQVEPTACPETDYLN